MPYLLHKVEYKQDNKSTWENSFQVFLRKLRHGNKSFMQSNCSEFINLFRHMFADSIGHFQSSETYHSRTKKEKKIMTTQFLFIWLSRFREDQNNLSIEVSNKPHTSPSSRWTSFLNNFAEKTTFGSVLGQPWPTRSWRSFLDSDLFYIFKSLLVVY